jgi:outer membrane receptor protein involved in Fe transport
MNLPRGFEFDSALRYIDSLPEPFVPSYVVMDLRFGWRPNQRWDLSLAAQNLLQTRHREFGAAATGREIEHSIYGKITWMF